MYAKAAEQTVGGDLIDAGTWIALVTLAAFVLWVAFLIGRALAPYVVGALIWLEVIE